MSRCGWNIRVQGGVENKISVTLDYLNSLLVLPYGDETALGITTTNVVRKEFARKMRHGRKCWESGSMIGEWEELELW